MKKLRSVSARSGIIKSTSNFLKYSLLSSFGAVLFSCSSNDDDLGDVVEAIVIPLECDRELDSALNFNAFVRNGVTLTSGDSEGPIAMGGDLTLNGIFTAAAHTGGTLYYGNENEASSLIVNGKINYVANEGVHINNGYVKVGDLIGSIVHDIDDNNTINNTRVTTGNYNDQPRIHVQRNQEAGTVGIGNIIDFETAFEELTQTSIYYSELIENVNIQSGSKISLINNSFNVLHITGEQLNDLGAITLNNQPTATSPLIINVDHEGDFIWNVRDEAGIGDQHGAYIIFNFYNSDTVTLDTGGGTVIGSVLAPNAHVIKKTSGNINGQLIANSYEHVSGELHQHVYNICDEDPCELIVNIGDKEVYIDLGEIYTLTARANYEDIDYVWSTDEITEAIEVSPTETTTYTLITTLENGCTTTNSVTVNIGTDPCLSQEFLVDAYTAIEELSSFLNIDIAIIEGQLVNYSISTTDGIPVGISADVNLNEGCNSININLNEEAVLESGTDYVVTVTGDTGWTSSVNFTTP